MKKLLSCLLVLVLMAGLFAGCNKGADASGKKIVRFATWDVAEDIDKQQKIVDTFNSSQEEIKVVLEAYGQDFDTKISASMGSNDAPDVMYMWNFADYHEGLENLDSYIESEGADYKNNFYEALWPYNSYGDSVYGIPVGYTSHVLFYNRDIFDKAGVEYPTDSWTWEDLRTASQQITESTNGATKGFVFPIKADPYDFEMYLWGNNTAICDASGNMSGSLNSPEAIEVFTTFQNLEKDGYAIGSEDSGTPNMSAGTAAMYINGSWPIGTLTDAGVNFGVAPIPQWKAGSPSPSIISSSGLSMSKDSENKNAAWEFIKFWTNEEANKGRIAFELPVLKTVVESEKLNEDAIKSVFYTMLDQSQNRTPASFIVTNWSEMRSELELALESILNPTSYADVKETLDAVVNP